MPVAVNAFTLAQQQFAPRAESQYPTPGSLAMAVDRGTRQSPALEVIDRALVQTARRELPGGDGHLLGIFMPPQEGKSQRVSRWFPLWLLYHDPTLRIGILSYSADKAIRWGRATRREVAGSALLQAKIHIRSDSRSAEHWETEEGGGIICAGIEGGITGEPLDVLIIDDPVRGRAEAESSTYRENAWDTWESNLTTRQSERFCAVLMMTRWHADDLAGRFSEREAGHWQYLTIPAIADSPDDPLGREIGEELPSVRGRQPGYFHGLQALRSSYVFASIYQQRPVPAEGGMFPRGKWRYWWPKDAPGIGPVIETNGLQWPLHDCMRFLTIDLAASVRTSADFTVVAAWAITPDGQLALLDRWRGRVVETEHWEKARGLLERWEVPKLFVESRMFGTTLVYAAGRAGMPIEELQADTDKVTRAIPAADLLHSQKMWLPANAPWLDEFLDELGSFPNAAHDDQVDVTAYAARVREAHWLRPQPPENFQPHEWSDPVVLADDVWSAPNLDLMHLNY